MNAYVHKSVVSSVAEKYFKLDIFSDASAAHVFECAKR